MRARLTSGTILLGGTLLAGTAWADPNGKDLFLKHKCNQCHTVTSQKIEALPPETPAPGEEAVEIKIKDLSAAGKEVDAAFLKDFLDKKVAAKDGKKHPRKFKGPEAEQAALVDWIVTLKSEPAK